MRKFECNNCVIRKCITYYDKYSSVDRPSRCTAGSEYISNWHEVKESNAENEQFGNSEQLPKLTAEVFNRPDCPEWARYAAVDKDGGLYFYWNEPSLETSAGEWSYFYGDNLWGRFDDNFDASDWQNSLIERPAKALPDWVKVGAVGYDNMNNEYFEVIKVNNDSFRAKYIDSSDSCSGLYFNEFCTEARKRPFNDKEMRELVGKVLETPNVALLVNAYMKVTKNIDTSCGIYTAEELRDRFTVDGKPCYKLEHLNEKGEWAE